MYSFTGSFSYDQLERGQFIQLMRSHLGFYFHIILKDDDKLEQSDILRQVLVGKKKDIINELIHGDSFGLDVYINSNSPVLCWYMITLNGVIVAMLECSDLPIYMNTALFWEGVQTRIKN